MIRILCFFALSLICAHAVGPEDKFDLAVTGLVIKGNTLDITIKITNQSAAPVKVDLACEALVFKLAKEQPSRQAQSIDTRTDIYKPRIVILVPEGESNLFPSKISKLFAPNTLKPGDSLMLTKTVSITPSTFVQDAAKTPYEVFVNLAYRTAGSTDCQGTSPSPTYLIGIDAQGKPALTAKP